MRKAATIIRPAIVIGFTLWVLNGSEPPYKRATFETYEELKSIRWRKCRRIFRGNACLTTSIDGPADPHKPHRKRVH
jgi:hypothetical protein